MTLGFLAPWSTNPPQCGLLFQQEQPFCVLATPISEGALVLSEILDGCCHVFTTKRREAVFCEVVFSQGNLLLKHE